MTQFVASAAFVGNAAPSEVRLTHPAGLQAGDSYVAVVVSNAVMAANPIVAPAGFTRKGAQGALVHGNSEAEVHYKTLTQADIDAGSFLFTQPSVASRITAACYVRRNTATGDFIDQAVADIETSTTNTHGTPPLAGLARAAAVVRFVMARNAVINTVSQPNTSWSTPAGETKRAEVFSASSSWNTMAVTDAGDADQAAGFVAPAKDFVAGASSGAALGLTLAIAAASAGAALPQAGAIAQTERRGLYLPVTGHTSVAWTIVSGAEQVVGGANGTAGGIDTTNPTHVLLHIVRRPRVPIVVRAVASNAAGSLPAQEYVIAPESVVTREVVTAL